MEVYYKKNFSLKEYSNLKLKLLNCLLVNNIKLDWKLRKWFYIYIKQLLTCNKSKTIIYGIIILILKIYIAYYYIL